MNILFVCRANLGRSQIAAALFNKINPSHHADSAGTHVEGNKGHNGQKISDFAKEYGGGVEHVLTVLEEEGIVTSHLTRIQLNEAMVDKYDKIIVMADKSDCPTFLLNSPKASFWEVEDVKGKNLETIRSIKEIIKKKISHLD